MAKNSKLQRRFRLVYEMSTLVVMMNLQLKIQSLKYKNLTGTLSSKFHVHPLLHARRCVVLICYFKILVRELIDAESI